MIIMEPVLNFDGWAAIMHYDKQSNPIWFSYYIWGQFLHLSIQMSKDLSIAFSKAIEVYDLYGMEGSGTAKIRIISDSSS